MWRQGSKRRGLKAREAERLAGNRTGVVTLRPMTEAKYAGFRAFIDEDYAREVSRAMDISLEEGQAAAAKQLGELLKDGLASEGHSLWKIVSEQDGAVGDLWTLADQGKQRAFIYFIGIDERHRGKGYGKAAMQALEAAVNPMGARRIDLNVFGDNTTAINMHKEI